MEEEGGGGGGGRFGMQRKVVWEETRIGNGKHKRKYEG
jgi:hypothetical protein